VESETRMRKFLQEAMPQIADRDFSFARICWDADTVDRQFLIDRPKGKNGLVVAAGGSGMGFMMMPVVGQLIVDRMEGVMEERLQKGLRWRPEQAVGRDWQASKFLFVIRRMLLIMSLQFKTDTVVKARLWTFTMSKNGQVGRVIECLTPSLPKIRRRAVRCERLLSEPQSLHPNLPCAKICNSRSPHEGTERLLLRYEKAQRSPTRNASKESLN
jgi:hypothetical protein